MIRIITDSSCDIDLNRAKEMGIEIIPIEVHFGEETYQSGVNLSTEEFYNKLKLVEKLPTTSQITPMTFEEKFKEYTEKGDEIIGMFLSTEMSGTYQNALMAKQIIGSNKIFIINTLQTTFALALLVIEAVKMRDRGLTAAEITDRVTELVPRVKLLASVETLKYLKMGGRLSSATAIIGGILGIYPILTVSKGKVEVVGKARGRAAANKMIHDMILKDGVSSDYGITSGNSDCVDACKLFEKNLSGCVGKKSFFRCSIGCIVGTHTGPGALGIAYIKK